MSIKMKQFKLTLLAVLMCFSAFSQFQNVTGTAQKNNITGKFRWNFGANGVLYPAELEDVAFDGNRPITAVVTGLTGVTPGGSDLATFLNNLFYPTQVPTASLSGGSNYELSVTAATKNLNWSYGRQAATAPISTAVINQGVGSVFTTQPSAGASVSGTVSVSTPANTNRTYTLTVTTTDGKTATASTTDNWLPKRYWGRTANEAANSADMLVNAGGGNILSNSRAGTFTITASGSNRIFIAYPSNLGDLTSINIGGLESIGAFVKNVVSFTNASGYTQNYNVYTSLNETSGNVTAITN